MNCEVGFDLGCEWVVLQGGSLGSFSEIYRLLQVREEEDDATSGLAAPKPEPEAPKVGDSASFQEVCNFCIFF